MDRGANDRRRRAIACLVIALTGLVGVATGPGSGVAGAQLPSGCVVDPADILGWWKGEDGLAAEIGDDLTGAAGFTNAVVRRGFALAPGNQLTSATLPAVTDGVSVDAWIRPTPTIFTEGLLSRWTFVDGGAGDDAYALLVDPGGLVFYVGGQSTLAPDVLSFRSPVLFDGQFHHVAATWGGGQMALYLDGVPVAARAVDGGTIAAATAPFRIGSVDRGMLPYTGAIDEPTVYRRSLTAAEVAAIHSAGPAGKCDPQPPNTQLDKLSDGAGAGVDDIFGRSVDLAGTRAVIGVSEDDPGGSARVYARSGTTFSPEGTLVGTDTAGGDKFGFAVAVDGNTAVVGAFEDDAGGFINRGSAYVFVRGPSGNWTQQAKLEPSTSTNVQNFGRSVDISGDTIVVGSFNDDSAGALDSGAVYVFTRAGTTWTQQARLTASDRQTADGLGYDVAVEGNTVLAGADLGDDDLRARNDAGAAYVFTRSGATWVETAKLNASDSDTGDEFGFAVALDGTTAVVGALTAGANGAGRAYAYVGTGSTWTEQAILEHPSGAFDDRFGFDVAVEGDLALVGARLDDDPVSGVDAGSVQVYLRTGSSWALAATLTAGDGAAGDEFGNAVSLHSGYALVGAYRDDEAGVTDRGAVYVFGT